MEVTRVSIDANKGIAWIIFCPQAEEKLIYLLTQI